MFVGGLLWSANGEPPTPPAPAPAPAVEANTTATEAWFTSKTGGFRIRFPRGWFFGPGPSPSDCSAWAPNEIYQTAPGTQFSIVAMDRAAPAEGAAPAADDATEMVRLTQESLKAHLTGYHAVDSGDLKPGSGLAPVTHPPAAGTPPRLGKYLVYTFTEEGRELAGVVFFLIEAKRQFVCHGRCLASRLDAARFAFTQTIQTLEITGPPVSPWESKDGRWINSEAGCSLLLPSGYTPDLAGGLTVFRRTAEDKSKPAPQLTLATEPLPMPIAWVVYLEGVKRGLRERLVDFKPLSDTVFTLETPTASVETHLFEYSQTVDKATVRVYALYCLTDHQLLVLTGSAPDSEFAAARDAIFLPAARGFQMTPLAPALAPYGIRRPIRD
ncbi:MAG TPA: hypothetical protein VL860_02585 [Planctomycetota bacterium]|nr:hypothetical protein [Planctomycetota bacterium]